MAQFQIIERIRFEILTHLKHHYTVRRLYILELAMLLLASFPCTVQCATESWRGVWERG